MTTPVITGALARALDEHFAARNPRRYYLRCRAEDVEAREREGWKFWAWIVGQCGDTDALMERKA